MVHNRLHRERERTFPVVAPRTANHICVVNGVLVLHRFASARRAVVLMTGDNPKLRLALPCWPLTQTQHNTLDNRVRVMLSDHYANCRRGFDLTEVDIQIGSPVACTDPSVRRLQSENLEELLRQAKLYGNTEASNALQQKINLRDDHVATCALCKWLCAVRGAEIMSVERPIIDIIEPLTKRISLSRIGSA